MIRTIVKSITIFCVLFILPSAKSALIDREYAEREECYNERVASVYTGKNLRTESCVSSEKTTEELSHFFNFLIYGGLAIAVVGGAYAWYESKVMREISPGSTKIEDILRKYALSKLGTKDYFSDLYISGKPKSDLATYAGERGIKIDTKDTKKDILEKLVKLELSKELKTDLLEYCHNNNIYPLSRATKPRIIEQIIESQYKE